MKRKLRLSESEFKSLLTTIVSEALSPSQYRGYVKEFNRERYDSSFKSLGDKYEHDRNYYRIYIPLESSTNVGPISTTEKEVSDFLSKNGYQVLDYIKGIVKFGESKNTTSIGKVLTRLKADDLMKKFVSDESRKALTSDASNLMVVISRHPYDIAGSDTDRNWTNCMTMAHPNSKRLTPLLNQYNEIRKEKDKWDDYFYNINIGKIKPSKEEHETNLKDYKTFLSTYDSSLVSKLKGNIDDRKVSGENVKYIINDVKEGSLTSYLIKKDDKNIQNPIAVLNIKPYINEINNNDFLLVSDNTMYGNGRPEFKSTVDSILNELNDGKEGFYCVSKKVYQDGNVTTVERRSKEDNEKFNQLVLKIKNILPSLANELAEEILDEAMSVGYTVINDFAEDNVDDDVFDIQHATDEFESEVLKQKGNLIKLIYECLISMDVDEYQVEKWIRYHKRLYNEFLEDKFIRGFILTENPCLEEITHEINSIAFEVTNYHN